MVYMNRIVSVIIPVWNTGKAAAKVARQLLKGEYKDLEVILVDDGSQDDSLTRLKALAKEQKRVKVLHQKNAGASAARNAGLAAAKGEYVMFVDSDDEVAPGFVAKMVAAMEKEVALAVCGIRYDKITEKVQVEKFANAYRERRKKEKLGDYVLESLVRDGRLYSSVNKIYRGDVIRKAKLRFEEGRDFAEDTKFVLDYLRAASGEIRFVPEALYIYKFGTETSTVKRSSAIWANWQAQMQDVIKFAKATGGVGIRTRVWQMLLWLRWRISWWKAKKRLTQNTETTEKTVGKYVVVGIVLTIFDFVICTILTRWIFRSNDMQEVAAMISGLVAMILGYILHRRITWRERDPGRWGIVKFFIWNIIMSVAVRPALTWFFGLWTGLYEFALMFVSWMGMSYDTVEYLGVYGLMTVVAMIINYLLYDKVVFGKERES